MKIENVDIHWFGHASFEIIAKGKKIFIDPYVLPKEVEKADILLITHAHYDHCANIEKVSNENTIIIAPENCREKVGNHKFYPIKEGGSYEFYGIKISAVPAYNINKNFHPRGFGVGYIIDVDGFKIYHAGDTDRIPEMKNFKVDLALLPIGGTYTMDEVEAAKAVEDMKPKYVIPMHYNWLEGLEKNPMDFERLVKGSKVIILKQEVEKL